MTHNTDPLTLKLSLREKCAYGMGDFGSNLMLCIGTLYLLKFYTDELGMPAFYGGIIFLVAKFFTAFTDMLTGVLLDSRRRNGRTVALHRRLYADSGAVRQPALTRLSGGRAGVRHRGAVLHVVVLQRGERALRRAYARSP